MITLASNIREQMQKNRYTGVAVDRKLKWAEGTMAQKLHRNENNIEHGFTVSDISIIMKLFDCTCMALFKGVDFTKDQK